MKLTITSVDHAPEELHDQVPIVTELLRMIPGPDRPDYWLGKIENPIKSVDNNIEKQIAYIVVAARWVGTQIDSNFRNLPVAIAYITDPSLLDDDELNFSKCQYTAIGLASAGEGAPEKLESIIAGRIGPAFGLGRPARVQRSLIETVKDFFRKHTGGE